ncbi:MAG: ornithine cyclodeaminase family protein [Hyphomicrobiaceae bacterium]|nr:ornithine cyclodeaminase family protein [Hyphomicrobiaceae bacterium]
MQFIDAAKIEQSLSYPAFIDYLEQAFRIGAIAPPRHHHTVPLADRPEATWLLMPAISAIPAADGKAPMAGPYMGMKSVTVFPDNAARSGKPAIAGTYLLLSTETGETLAILDATRLTVWRTAAASALAARYLARPDTANMLMVGAGALAPYLIRAHASVRPIREVAIWNRTRANAEKLASEMSSPSLKMTVVDDLEGAARSADLISTATISSAPLIHGAWLRPGTHVDSVGAYNRSMRETDDALVARARVFADTRVGAFGEAGDILQPIASGAITPNHVLGELADLVTARVLGRQSTEEVTFFKSVGASIEDLAAAIAVYENARHEKIDTKPD